MIKLSIVKYMYKKLEVRMRDVKIFSRFIKLKLFSTGVINTLWKRLKDPIIGLVDLIIKQPKDNVDSNFEFTLGDENRRNVQEVKLLSEKIDNIFRECDLLIASEICGTWREKICLN